MPTYSQETRALLDALSRRTIAYHPDLATSLGSIPAAVILGQLLYWHGKQADAGGWIVKTARDLEAETAVTERQQETVRALLISVGAVEFERRGIPAMPFWRVNHDKIIALYLHKKGDKNPQTGETLSPPNGDSLFPPPSILKFPPNGDTNTEITKQETTQEITSETKGEDVPGPASRPNLDEVAKAAGIDRQPSIRSKKAKAAAKTRELDKYNTSDLQGYPSLQIYWDVFRGVLLPRELAQKIVDSVGEPTRWEETCEEWAKGNPTTGKTWNPLSVDKMLDLYRAKCAQARANGPNGGAPAVSKADAALALLRERGHVA